MWWLNVLAANVRKAAIERLRYWPNSLSTLATLYIIFLLAFFGVKMMASPGASAENTRYLIVVMVLWSLALTAMQGIGREITTEATRGTLEQLYMTPVETWVILAARIVGTVLIEIVVMALVLLAGMVTAQEWLSVDLLTLAPLLLLTVACMAGVGFMMAGLALVFKRIQSFFQIVQFAVVALVAVPVSMSPWLDLAPAVRGASMVRSAMIDGVGLTGFTGSAWLLLAANAAAYFVVGVGVYRLAERRARRLGLLGEY